MTMIKAFKGFNPDLTCRGFQYVEGQTYEQAESASLCNTGFHGVLLPLDALKYYKPGSSVYHEVELDDVDSRREADSKVAGRKITIGASIGIPGLVRAHVEAIWSKATEAGKKAAEGSKATTGDSANAATTGDYANAATTGRYAHAATTGDSANAATTGDYANAATTGDYANAATTGDYANAATTGRYANAATTGYSADIHAQVKDEGSIAAVLGMGSAAGAVGCWLVLTERDANWNILGVQAIQVDGEEIKGGVFYTLRDGKVVSA